MKITEEEMEKQSKVFLNAAIENLSHDKNLLPVLMVIKDNNLVQVALPWRNEREKYAMLDLIIPKLRELKPDVMYFIGEAWSAKAEQGEEVRPASKMPNKAEIVMVLAMSEAKTMHISSVFKRDEKGEIVSFGEVEVLREGLQSCMFDGVFDRTETLH
jgi:hypothetical protein